jgi:hypothetical protein
MWAKRYIVFTRLSQLFTTIYRAVYFTAMPSKPLFYKALRHAYKKL